jgi:S-DNA-T family DNA segregation ATPase FtsK/SpoIIIE
MARGFKRRHYRKQKFKIKLKKNTVYSIFAFLTILSGILFGLSFSRSGSSFASLNDYLISYFGKLDMFFPLFLVILGFFFLRLKNFLSKPNLIIGFSIFYVCLLGLTRQGTVGIYLNNFIADALTPLGAFFVYLVGVFVGLTVLFDKSVDEVISMISAVFSVFGKIFPRRFINFFKKKPPALEDKQLVIKGMTDKETKEIKINTLPPIKKSEPIISEKLVMNAPGQTGIWRLPPIDLLSADSSQKADRGDVKEIAGRIENTLKNFGIGAKVVEVNLGPAVTQYAIQNH